MKKLALILAILFAAVVGLSAQPPAEQQFKTGARLTPLPKILEAIRTGKAGVHQATRELLPATVAMVPPKLTVLGNDRYGDCVTAESCAAIEADSVYLGLPEIIITDAIAVAWAQAHGWLNGADLLSVIQDMGRDGVKDSTGKLWRAGIPSTVDYTSEATLQSAIATGPVSIAIGSGDLPSGAGNKNGWYALTSRGTANDHCVGLWGYGRAEDLYKAMSLPCPSACAGKTGYLLYTWGTIGFVTHAWIVGTVQEAWVRTPTVVGLTPPTPKPPDPPTPPLPPAPPLPPGTFPQLTLDKPLPAGTYLQVPAAAWQQMQSEQKATKDSLDSLKAQLKAILDRLGTAEPPMAKPQNDAALDAIRSDLASLRAAVQSQRVTVLPGARVFASDGYWRPLENFLTTK